MFKFVKPISGTCGESETSASMEAGMPSRGNDRGHCLENNHREDPIPNNKMATLLQRLLRGLTTIALCIQTINGICGEQVPKLSLIYTSSSILSTIVQPHSAMFSASNLDVGVMIAGNLEMVVSEKSVP